MSDAARAKEDHGFVFDKTLERVRGLFDECGADSPVLEGYLAAIIIDAFELGYAVAEKAK